MVLSGIYPYMPDIYRAYPASYAVSGGDKPEMLMHINTCLWHSYVHLYHHTILFSSTIWVREIEYESFWKMYLTQIRLLLWGDFL